MARISVPCPAQQALAREAAQRAASGMTEPWPADWSGKWLAVHERAGNKCELCGKVRALLVHHVHPDTQGCENPDDILAICQECHGRQHSCIGEPFDNFSVSIEEEDGRFLRALAAERGVSIASICRELLSAGIADIQRAAPQNR